MNYTFNKNTYFSKPKDDPKDRIELEVGDSKQDNFLPQIKIMRWDNEVNFSARLIHNELNPVVSKQGDKIKWSGNKVSADIYPLADGHEFEVILKERPNTNVIQFSLNTKGLKFLYQPELTQEEIVNGQIRPDNVIGSYAVYASEEKYNFTNGKMYMVGKVGHIYRPKIEDANSNWTWGFLDIANDILQVTIPQDFLDNAIYPVKHAAGLTFGYTNAGASYGAWGENYWRGRRGQVSVNGLVDSINVYTSSVVTRPFKAVTVADSDKTIITNGIGNEINVSNTVQWWEITYTTKPSVTNGSYYFAGACAGGAGGNYHRVYYDSGGSAGDGGTDTTNNTSSPTDPTDGTFTTTLIWSIYATYTASSAIKLVNGLATTSVKSKQGLAIASVKNINGLA